MPYYEDDEAWQTTHNLRHTEKGEEEKRALFVKKYPNWETLKENCYSEATKGFQNCNPSDGWCGECARKDSWELEQSRKSSS